MHQPCQNVYDSIFKALMPISEASADITTECVLNDYTDGKAFPCDQSIHPVTAIHCSACLADMMLQLKLRKAWGKDLMTMDW